MQEIMVSRTRYLIQTDPRTNTLYVDSCHPYDDAEYHWARQSAKDPLRWTVYRNGERVSILEGYTPEEVAGILSRFDTNAHIKPVMVHC